MGAFKDLFLASDDFVFFFISDLEEKKKIMIEKVYRN